MITSCCNKPVPPEAEKDVIMPCGKCCFCCNHTHIMGHTFPRGTDLTEAFTQILNGESPPPTPEEEEYWFAFHDIDLIIVKVKGDPEDAYILPFEHTEWLRYRDVIKQYTLMNKVEMPDHPLDYSPEQEENECDCPCHASLINGEPYICEPCVAKGCLEREILKNKNQE